MFEDLTVKALFASARKMSSKLKTEFFNTIEEAEKF